MNLFNVESDMIDKLGGKGPRKATNRECGAYLKWQRERLGLADLEFQGLEWSGYYSRGRDTRICIGGTFGQQTEPARHEYGRWEGEDYRPGTSTPAQYENGAYSLLMPGYAASRAIVTMETLNDAGEVVASQALPIEPKKGGIVWTKEAVRAAHGPIAKANASKTGSKAAGKAKRSPAHVRAIKLAWAQRRARIRAEQVSAIRFAEIRRLTVESAARLSDYQLANSCIADAMAAIDLANARAAKVQECLTVAEYAKGQLVRIIKERQAERDESREWAALLEAEIADLSAKRPALRLAA